MRLFVTGGTGLVGRRLLERLRDRDADLVVLTRRIPLAESGGAKVTFQKGYPAVAGARLERFPGGPPVSFLQGDPTVAGPWMETLAMCDAVVHLAGENIFAHRCSEAF